MMTLEPGSQIGKYRITAHIGSGGMGEVYRASDSDLGRDVAIKVLPANVASDATRLARFEREARTLAALNHPNIAVIHGVERSAGTMALVMEHVDGRSLADLIAAAPAGLPLADVIDIGRQMAVAIGAAHTNGVIHRDLKPANVLIRPDGMVKVLDFGLAKALADDTEGSDDKSTVTTPAVTVAGVVLGTAAYMAPEQAAGRTLDRRCDIWSFGAVLYEMLTGCRAFDEASVSETLAAVIRDEPDWRRIRPDCPPGLLTLVRRCLRKRPEDRLQDIGDARLELVDLQSAPETPQTPESEAAGPARKAAGPAWVALAASALLGAGLTWAALGREGPAENTRIEVPMHFLVNRPEGLAMPEYGFPVMSPDGRYLVFAGAAPGEPSRLWVGSHDGRLARALPDTDEASSPFWSPDGRTIGFFTPTEMRRIAVDATVSQAIAQTGRPGYFGNWLRDGSILFRLDGAGPLLTVSAAGGVPTPLSTLADGDTNHDFPSVSPDERYVFFYIGGTDPDRVGLYRLRRDDPDDVRLVSHELTLARFSSGYLLYVLDNTLLARRFDPETVTFSGEARALADNVAEFSPDTLWSIGLFHSSSSGAIVFPEARDASTQLTWVDRTGRALATVGEPARFGQIALSPDRRRLAAEIAGPAGIDLWLVDMERGVTTRLTFGPDGEVDPVWSPDGREVLFTSMNAGRRSIQLVPVSGPPDVRTILDDARDVMAEGWLPGGREFSYLEGLEAPRSIKVGQIDGTAPDADVLVRSDFLVDEPQVSPDGRWMVYMSSESGRYEIYAQPFRREGERVRISREGGGQPKWSPDGTEVFFAAPNGDLMVAAVQADDRFDVNRITRLFPAGLTRPDYDDYALSADGQRVLLKAPVASGDAVFHVLLNWEAQLQQ